MPKKIITFTENFLLSLKEFSHDVLIQPVIINKAYWEAINIENRKKEIKQKEKQKYYSTINRLVKYGYLMKKRENNQLKIKLTDKGILKTQRLFWKTNQKKKPKNKNKEFCLVVFDIPEKKRRIRNLFRKCLYEIGFERLQKSVFICYKDVFQEIKSLINNCELDDYVKIIKGRKI